MLTILLNHAYLRLYNYVFIIHLTSLVDTISTMKLQQCHGSLTLTNILMKPTNINIEIIYVLHNSKVRLAFPLVKGVCYHVIYHINVMVLYKLDPVIGYLLVSGLA